MEESNKKTIVLTVIGVLTFIGLVVGATYAYFVAQGGVTDTSGVNINASTTDNFVLETGDPIGLNINQENFASGKGNISGSTYAKATLTANNKTNTATEHYYLYLNITQNELQYTTAEKKPELILTVKDDSNNPITSINGLTYNSTLGGFDITETNGLITILDNREIKVEESNSKHQTIENWNITITMINLTTDQSDNAGKNFKAEINIVNKKILIADYITNLYTTDGTKGLYKHDGQGTYGTYEAGDGSYRFAGTNPNNYVCFGSSATTCPTDNLYRIIGIFNGRIKLIKYDYATTAQLGTDGAYYGSTGSPNASYYKGKMTAIPWYYWNNSTNTNTWSESNLNTINLNKNYWNNLGSTWQAYIDDTDWKVGGNTWANIGTATNSKTVYTNEITSPAASTTYRAKIGLMYVSDFRYAADPTKSNSWSNLASNSYSTVHTDNWMSMGFYDWTISRRSGTTDRAFYVYNFGIVNANNVSNNNYVRGVRPSFYLKSTVELAGGSGTASDPYRLA